MSFTVKTPETVEQAALALSGGDSVVLAGGTDLMVWVAEGSCQPEHVVNIASIPALQKICLEDGYWRIGAAVTFSQLLEEKGFPDEFACLLQAAAQTGGPQIRNSGTVGGNICTASPAGDLCCALACLDASVELCSTTGTRQVPLQEFFTGPKRTVRRPEELLTAVIVPVSGGKSMFAKLGKRNSLIIATANISVWLRQNAGVVESVRIAVGSAAPTVVRAQKAEGYLAGKQLDAQALAHAQDLLDEGISPITDLRATGSYRRKVCKNLLADCLQALMEGEA